MNHYLVGKSYRLINSLGFFLLILLTFIVFHLVSYSSANLGDLSSDIWMVQYVMIQEQESSWAYVPPFYNQERFYLAYPLFYFLNPGLTNNLLSYHIVMVLLICITYLVTGLVFKKIFNNWIIATLGGLLFLIPHFIFPTRIGLLGFQNFRGLGFSFPFYALLSYYWIIYGLNNKYKNILLAILAAVSVYVYPPFGVIIVPIFIASALIISGKTKLLQIIIFVLVYLLGSSLFWYGHFSNPNSRMTDNESSLSNVELQLQSDIIAYRIPDSSLRGSDFGVIKRSIWDGGLLVVIFLFSLLLFNKSKPILNESQRRFFWMSIVVLSVLLFFIFGVEIVNWVRFTNGSPPIFIEHWRLMRVSGFILIGQSVFLVFCLYWTKIKYYKIMAVIVSLALILTPLSMSAPLVRLVVRSFVPETIRIKYNLAPIVLPTSTRFFTNLQDSAVWTKNYLPHNTTKIFVFSELQEDFIFKVMSRHETNLTNKEGSIWITSGFDNSVRWYEERMQYKKIVENATNFSDILDFAKSLKMTHMLIPRGKYEDLFISSGLDLKTVYQNYDYRLIVI